MVGFDYNFFAQHRDSEWHDMGPQNIGNFSNLGTINNLTNEGSDTFSVGDMVDTDLGGQFAGTFEIDGNIFIVFQNGLEYEVFGRLDDPDNFEAPGTLPTVNASPFIVCFLAGTRIATPDGERAVEDLTIGDLVLTADGRAVSVKWMGRQRMINHPFGVPQRRAPVCIAAGALGQDLPRADLYVSAGHGMVWEGLLVNAGAMVNGTSIRFVPLSELPATFTYFHIETEGHEVVLANGAPAETFVDYVTRSHFDNFQEYLDLYGAERVLAELPHPRVSSQRMLPDVLRAKLGIAPFGTGPAEERNALLQRLGEAAKAA